MVFATKLQINATFKKAAPAKKTVTPAKKVRVVIHIVREESVSFEIRAHHHRLILGGKRGRKRAKKKEKHNRHFHLRAMNERERKNARANARSLFSNALKK
jgi:hypothetical protein